MSIRLSRHLLIRTRRAEELCQAYGRVYAKPTLKVKSRGQFEGAASQFRIGDTRIRFASFSTETEWDFPNADTFLFLFPIDRGGYLRTRGRECEVKLGRTVGVSPGGGYTARYDPAFRCFSITVEPDALKSALETLIGAPADKPLVFDPQGQSRGLVSSSLESYIPLLAETIERTNSDLPAWWNVQTEHLVAMMLLCGYRHNYSRLLEPDPREPSLAQLRRAAAYIEANCHTAVNIEDLARESGVSIFSLNRGFKRMRGCSPLEFAARCRRRKGLTR